MTMVNFRPKFIVVDRRPEVLWTPRCAYRGLHKPQFPGGAADVAVLSAGDRVRAGSPATASWIQVALRLSQPFVTEPSVRAKRMERKIVRSSRQLDFMNVDGLAAVPHQYLLSQRLLLRRVDAYPD